MLSGEFVEIRTSDFHNMCPNGDVTVLAAEIRPHSGLGNAFCDKITPLGESRTQRFQYDAASHGFYRRYSDSPITKRRSKSTLINKSLMTYLVQRFKERRKNNRKKTKQRSDNSNQSKGRPKNRGKKTTGSRNLQRESQIKKNQQTQSRTESVPEQTTANSTKLWQEKKKQRSNVREVETSELTKLSSDDANIFDYQHDASDRIGGPYSDYPSYGWDIPKGKQLTLRTKSENEKIDHHENNQNTFASTVSTLQPESSYSGAKSVHSNDRLHHVLQQNTLKFRSNTFGRNNASQALPSESNRTDAQLWNSNHKQNRNQYTEESSEVPHPPRNNDKMYQVIMQNKKQYSQTPKPSDHYSSVSQQKNNGQLQKVQNQIRTAWKENSQGAIPPATERTRKRLTSSAYPSYGETNQRSYAPAPPVSEAYVQPSLYNSYSAYARNSQGVDRTQIYGNQSKLVLPTADYYQAPASAYGQSYQTPAPATYHSQATSYGQAYEPQTSNIYTPATTYDHNSAPKAMAEQYGNSGAAYNGYNNYALQKPNSYGDDVTTYGHNSAQSASKAYHTSYSQYDLRSATPVETDYGNGNQGIMEYNVTEYKYGQKSAMPASSGYTSQSTQYFQNYPYSTNSNTHGSHDSKYAQDSTVPATAQAASAYGSHATLYSQKLALSGSNRYNTREANYNHNSALPTSSTYGSPVTEYSQNSGLPVSNSYTTGETNYDHNSALPASNAYGSPATEYSQNYGLPASNTYGTGDTNYGQNFALLASNAYDSPATEYSQNYGLRASNSYGTGETNYGQNSALPASNAHGSSATEYSQNYGLPASNSYDTGETSYGQNSALPDSNAYGSSATKYSQNYGLPASNSYGTGETNYGQNSALPASNAHGSSATEYSQNYGLPASNSYGTGETNYGQNSALPGSNAYGSPATEYNQNSGLPASNTYGTRETNYGQNSALPASSAYGSPATEYSQNSGLPASNFYGTRETNYGQNSALPQYSQSFSSPTSNPYDTQNTGYRQNTAESAPSSYQSADYNHNTGSATNTYITKDTRYGQNSALQTENGYGTHATRYGPNSGYAAPKTYVREANTYNHKSHARNWDYDSTNTGNWEYSRPQSNRAGYFAGLNRYRQESQGYKDKINSAYQDSSRTSQHVGTETRKKRPVYQWPFNNTGYPTDHVSMKHVEDSAKKDQVEAIIQCDNGNLGMVYERKDYEMVVASGVFSYICGLECF